MERILPGSVDFEARIMDFDRTLNTLRILFDNNVKSFPELAH